MDQITYETVTRSDVHKVGFIIQGFSDTGSKSVVSENYLFGACLRAQQYLIDGDGTDVRRVNIQRVLPRPKVPLGSAYILELSSSQF